MNQPVSHLISLIFLRVYKQKIQFQKFRENGQNKRKSQKLIHLSTDRGCSAESRKWTLRGSHFLKIFAKIGEKSDP